MRDGELREIADDIAQRRRRGLRDWREACEVVRMLWPEMRSRADHYQRQEPLEGRERARQRAVHEVLSMVRLFGGISHPVRVSRIGKGSIQLSSDVQHVIEESFPADWLSRSHRHSGFYAGRYPIEDVIRPIFLRVLLFLILSVLTLTVVQLVFLILPGSAWVSVLAGLILAFVLACPVFFIWENLTWRRSPPDPETPLGTQGQYLRIFQYLSVSGSDKGEWDWQSQVVHEFCHRAEQVMPRIVEMERRYCWDRKRRGGEPFAIGYAEPRLCGAWFCSPRCFFEVLTTGYQAIMFGYEDKRDNAWHEEADPEHRDFVLGLVAAC